MILRIRTDSSHKDFIDLVKQLDAYLSEVDGDDHSFYSQFNKIDVLNQVVLIYEDETVVACGAFKIFEPGVAEVKRMFTIPTKRGTGKASLVLQGIEEWAGAIGFHTLRLETGKRMVDAVAFYEKNGYSIIPNYGQYIGVPNSVCFEKKLEK